MVWKIRKFMLVCLSVCTMLIACATDTFAYDVYNSGNISTTYNSLFEDIVQGLPVNDDYVFFRNSQYEYILIAGDLDYNGVSFSANTKLKEYILTTTQASYNNYYTYEVNEIDGMNLNTTNKIVYSNLGDFPRLIERGSTYEYTQLFTLVIIGCCLLVRPIFEFILRLRS